MDRAYSEVADVSSPIDLAFGSLANSLVLLLEAAKSELEHDQDAARTSLAAASSILQLEIERRSGTSCSRTGGLAGWQIARVRSFIDRNLHKTIHASDLRCRPYQQRSGARVWRADRSVGDSGFDSDHDCDLNDGMMPPQELMDMDMHMQH